MSSDIYLWPIPVAARCKVLVCGRALVGIMGSNPTVGMDVCILWVFVLSGRGLCDGPIPRPDDSYWLCSCVCLSVIKRNQKPSTPAVNKYVEEGRTKKRNEIRVFTCWPRTSVWRTNVLSCVIGPSFILARTLHSVTCAVFCCARVQTNYVKQSPSWETNISSTYQKILRIWWNLKVHYRVHNSPPIASILSQISPVQYIPSYFFNVYFNIFLPSN
jgi:hypothetical protein